MCDETHKTPENPQDQETAEDKKRRAKELTYRIERDIARENKKLKDKLGDPAPEALKAHFTC